MAINGTLVRGTATFPTGKFGSAMSGAAYNVAGVDSTFPSGGNLSTFTIECWLNSTTTNAKIFIGRPNWYYLQVPNGRVTVKAGSSDQMNINGAITITDGVWHHVAVVFNAGVMTLYVDGVRDVTSSTAAPVSGTDYTAIGGFGSAGGNDFVGSIDEVRFSSIARYTGASFTPPTAAFADDSNTTGLYHLESNANDSHGAAPADTTAPTVPGTPTATAGAASASVAFAASTDDVGVAGYRVFSSADSYAAAVATGSSSPITVSGLTNGTAYTFKVAAYDAAGNQSAQSAASNSVTPAAATGNIAANDANIIYSPYTWDVTAARAKTINSGAYFSALLVGSATSITANFDLANISAPVPQISYRIDRGPWTSVPVATTVALTIPSTNVWTKHFVEIRVKSTTETATSRWNVPNNTAVVFTGFTTNPTTVTTAVVRKKRFNLLAYGDSITEGVRTLGSTQTNDTDRNDAALAWAYPLGDLLGAEIGVVGFGATGLTASGSGYVPPLPTSYNQLWNGTARSFTPVPDLILLNEGTNDSGDITSVATTLLNNLLSAASTAKIAVVQQWNGTSHKTQWQAAIAACSTPSRVTYVDTTGWWSSGDASDSLHPYGYVNVADLAPRLAAVVGPLLAGSVVAKRFVNVGGVAKPIG